MCRGSVGGSQFRRPVPLVHGDFTELGIGAERGCVMPRGVLLDFYGTVVHEDDEVVAAVCAEIHAGVARPGEVSVKEIGTYWWRSFPAMCTNAQGELNNWSAS